MSVHETKFPDREFTAETKNLLLKQIEFLENNNEKTKYNTVVVLDFGGKYMRTLAIGKDGRYMINTSIFAGCFTESSANELAEEVKKVYPVQLKNAYTMPVLDFYKKRLTEYQI